MYCMQIRYKKITQKHKIFKNGMMLLNFSYNSSSDIDDYIMSFRKITFVDSQKEKIGFGRFTAEYILLLILILL